jgi:hypothetical protein
MTESGRHFEAGHPGHRDIEDNHVRPQGAHGIERLDTIMSGTYDDAFRPQNRRCALDHRVAVVDKEDTNRRGRIGFQGDLMGRSCSHRAIS